MYIFNAQFIIMSSEYISTESVCMLWIRCIVLIKVNANNAPATKAVKTSSYSDYSKWGMKFLFRGNRLAKIILLNEKNTLIFFVSSSFFFASAQGNYFRFFIKRIFVSFSAFANKNIHCTVAFEYSLVQLLVMPHNK